MLARSHAVRGGGFPKDTAARSAQSTGLLSSYDPFWLQINKSPRKSCSFLRRYARSARRIAKWAGYPMSGFHSLLNIAVANRGPEYEGIYQGTWIHPNPDEEEEPWVL